MIARLSPDLGHVEIRGSGWSDRFQVACLPRWIAFYTRMRDRAGGRHAQHYAETVAALVRVQREMGDAPPPSGGAGQSGRPA